MKLCDEIPLLDTPRPEWESDFRHLLADRELRRVYDRERRLRLAIKTMGLVDHQLTGRPQGIVCELGTDTGEFLECCRKFKHAVVGFQPPTVHPGLAKLGALLHERQKIKVVEGGLEAFESFDGHADVELVYLPKLESVLPDHLTENREDAIRRSRWWKIDPWLDRALIRLLCVSFDHLRPGGRLVIGLEGTLNQRPFEARLDAVIFRVGGFKLSRAANGYRKLTRLG